MVVGREAEEDEEEEEGKKKEQNKEKEEDVDKWGRRRMIRWKWWSEK